MLGASSWYETSGCLVPVAASNLPPGNHFRKSGSTVKISTTPDVRSEPTRAMGPAAQASWMSTGTARLSEGGGDHEEESGVGCSI